MADHRPRVLFVVVATVVAVIGFIAFSLPPTTLRADPLPTWPVDPEVLPAPASSIPAAFGRATWALDPAYPAPSAETADLHILVWEQACSSGSPATGRMSAPMIVSDASTVTITIGVRPRSVGDGILETCPGPPGTPAILRLPDPLGSRSLLDGGLEPPAPPSSPFS